ncbi:MAG: hypothetical protein J6A77_03790 [Lachnospiraceae bacterium]|nr:hypothetical protein [Lachnospiraceae bacterium]
MLERVNDTGFSATLMEYIKQDGMVIGGSAGSLLLSNNLVGNLGLMNKRLDKTYLYSVHISVNSSNFAHKF